MTSVISFVVGNKVFSITIVGSFDFATTLDIDFNFEKVRNGVGSGVVG